MTDQVRTGSDSADPWHGLPSPLDAVSDMRASARWIVGAAAAVGAVLLGGGPLTAVGKVHGLGSAAAAYVGLVVGLAGVGWAIWHVTDALLPPVTTLATLQSPPLADLRAEIAADPGTFYGPFGTSVGELQAAYLVYGKASANIATMLAIEADSAQHRLLEQGYADATANTAQIQARLRWLLALAHAWRVRDQLRRARSHAFAGAAVAALGAVIFVAATSSQTATGSPHRAPTPAATASRSHR